MSGLIGVAQAEPLQFVGLSVLLSVSDCFIVKYLSSIYAESARLDDSVFRPTVRLDHGARHNNAPPIILSQYRKAC